MSQPALTPLFTCICLRHTCWIVAVALPAGLLDAVIEVAGACVPLAQVLPVWFEACAHLRNFVESERSMGCQRQLHSLTGNLRVPWTTNNSAAPAAHSGAVRPDCFLFQYFPFSLRGQLDERSTEEASSMFTCISYAIAQQHTGAAAMLYLPAVDPAAPILWGTRAQESRYNRGTHWIRAPLRITAICLFLSYTPADAKQPRTLPITSRVESITRECDYLF